MSLQKCACGVKPHRNLTKKPWYGAVVPVNSTHPDYDSSLPAWLRARDVLAGEDAVKIAAEKYLPRLESQSDDEYKAYLAWVSARRVVGRAVR